MIFDVRNGSEWQRENKFFSIDLRTVLFLAAMIVSIIVALIASKG